MKRFACVPASAVFDPRLKPAHRRCLEVIGLHTDKNGRSHLKKATIATVMGTHPKNVQRYVRELEGWGHLRRIERRWPHGGQRENTYELVLGGEYAATPRGGVHADSPHEEGVLELVTTPALLGPGEENLDMQRTNLRETEGPSATLPDEPVKKPTRPKAKKAHPEKQNAMTVGQYFVTKARAHQWGHPGAATVGQMTGTFRRWHNDEGVSYREILRAIDIFFAQLPADLSAPAGKIFIKQGFDWITQAKGDIYREELPKIQEINVEMWEHIYADLDAWITENPGSTQEERSAMKAALWHKWRYEEDPKYALPYA